MRERSESGSGITINGNEERGALLWCGSAFSRAEKPERWEVNEGGVEEQVEGGRYEAAGEKETRGGGGAEKIEKQGGERGWFENVIFLPALA